MEMSGRYFFFLCRDAKWRGWKGNLLEKWGRRELTIIQHPRRSRSGQKSKIQQQGEKRREQKRASERERAKRVDGECCEISSTDVSA